MLDFYFSHDRPFGPLEPVHRYILDHAGPITLANAFQAMIVPCAPLGVLAYLLQFQGTRPWRVAIAVVGLALIVRSVVSFRFYQPEFNAFNNGLTIAWLHLSIKYIEFAMYSKPVLDPYVPKGRSKVVAALDLCINSRMVGLGIVGLDRYSSPSTSVNTPNGSDGAVATNGHTVPPAKQSPNDERHLPPRPTKQRSRSQILIRHARLAFTYYFVFDLLLTLMYTYGSDTIANAVGIPNSVYLFSHTKKFIILPKTPMEAVVPWWFIELFVELGVGTVVWIALAEGYHAIAFLTIASGWWEPDSWEVDLFLAPWKADSILDLWGRRWHQLFRHHFILVSSVLLRVFRISPKSSLSRPIMLVTVFTGSGLLHALGEISMDPVPAVPEIFIFFVLSGIGCAAEILFKRLTGRRVGGMWGRAWTCVFMLTTSRLAMKVWMDGGVGGCSLTPPGPGGVVARWLARDVIVAEHV